MCHSGKFGRWRSRYEEGTKNKHNDVFRILVTPDCCGIVYNELRKVAMRTTATTRYKSAVRRLGNRIVFNTVKRMCTRVTCLSLCTTNSDKCISKSACLRTHSHCARRCATQDAQIEHRFDDLSVVMPMESTFLSVTPRDVTLTTANGMSNWVCRTSPPDAARCRALSEWVLPPVCPQLQAKLVAGVAK